MNFRNTTGRYGSLSIGMHRLMLALLIGVYASIELRELFPKGSDPREAMKTWYFTLGLSVFALVFVRLVLRAMGPTPQIRPLRLAWKRALAALMHLALYAFMIVMPVLGRSR